MTKDDLIEIIKKTREENGGLSIDTIARAFREVFDDAEMRAFIRDLEYYLEK